MFPEGFEWDPEKNDKNQEKHGYSFEIAVDFFKQTVYESPVYMYNGEERRFATGEYDSKEITVIFCERDHNKRIISIRRARGYERNIYRKRIQIAE